MTLNATGCWFGLDTCSERLTSWVKGPVESEMERAKRNVISVSEDDETIRASAVAPNERRYILDFQDAAVLWPCLNAETIVS